MITQEQEEEIRQAWMNDAPKNVRYCDKAGWRDFAILGADEEMEHFRLDYIAVKGWV